MDALAGLWRGVLVLGPRLPDDRRAAAQALLGVGVALSATLAVGRPEWAPYAAFGAFCGLYGRNRPAASRRRRQLVAAGILVAVTTAGAGVGTLQSRNWWVVVGCTLVTCLAGMLVAVEEWRPPGPTFAVFAFGSVGSLAHSPDDVVAALLVSAASAGFTVLVGVTQGYVARKHVLEPPIAVKTAEQKRWLPVAAASSTAVSGSIAVLMGLDRPYWAMVATVAVLTGRSRRHQVQRATERVCGTVLGLVVAAPLLALASSDELRVGMVAGLQFLIEIVVARNYTLALVLITPQALLMTALGTAGPVLPLLADRGVETVLGAVVALTLLGLGGLHVRGTSNDEAA